MIARPALTRRTAAVGLVLALALPVVAGCGLDTTDETAHERGQVQAAADQIGGIHIRNAFIVASSDASTPASGTATSYLVVTFVNNGPADSFTGVSTTFGTATLSGPGTSGGQALPLPTGVVVKVGTPLTDPSAPTVTIAGTAQQAGTTTPVQFTFTNAGTTRQLEVPVQAPEVLLAPTQPVPTETAIVPTEDFPSASG